MSIAIRAAGLSKRYAIGSSSSGSFLHAMRRRRRPDPPSATVWALDDVSFEVEEGTTFGVVGRNGAGKSTLLKILSRVTLPTAGFADIDGSVGSLLEVGTGFQPELTGRENVFLSGAILGMSRRQISANFDEIVSFAEVERFIDTPVKRYSSGMLVRLGFAVAAHLDADILLIDEVLAVGDASFQKRCVGKTRDVARQGRTVFLVSHQLGMVSSLCDRAILLDGGRITSEGPAPEVVETYLGSLGTEGASAHVTFPPDPTKPAQIVSATARRSGGERAVRYDVFDPIEIEVVYNIRQQLEATVVHLVAKRNDEVLFVSFDTDANPRLLDLREPGVYRARVLLPSPLKPGRYNIELAVWRLNVGGIDVRSDAIVVEVDASTFDASVRSYFPGRLGPMAAHLVWDAERITEEEQR